MPIHRPGWPPPCRGRKARVTFSNGTRVTVAAELAELVKLLGDETIRRGYDIRPGVTGGYNCRRIAGTEAYSNHAWGLAVDINWDCNPMGAPLRTDMPPWMPPLWEAHGFRWGGTYRRPDSMHYEFMGTSVDAAAMTARARRLAGAADGPIAEPTGDDDVALVNLVKERGGKYVYAQWSNGTKTWLPTPRALDLVRSLSGRDIQEIDEADDMMACGPIIGPKPPGVNEWGVS